MTLNAARRNRRALVLLAGAVAVYLVASQVVLPWYDQVRAAPEDVAEKTERLRKYRRELARRADYEKLAADTSKKIDEVRTHFFAADVGGSAELQKMVEEGAKSVGISLAQRNVTDPRKVDDFVAETAMTLTFEATPNQLVGFLAQLKAATRIVKVKSAQIDPVQVAHEAPKAGELRKILRVNMTVAGTAVSAPAQGRMK
jgi:hypothetical protein